jgi:hypothetical protein
VILKSKNARLAGDSCPGFWRLYDISANKRGEDLGGGLIGERDAEAESVVAVGVAGARFRNLCGLYRVGD